MRVKVSDEEELVELSRELLHILVNLRHFTIIWGEHFGGTNLVNKKRWERRADELLEKLKVSKSYLHYTEKIEIENINQTENKIEQ